MAAVFAVGVGGTYFGLQQTNEQSATLSTSTGFMMGHVTATAVNADGEIYAYRQSDNAIVEGGMELIASQLFEGLNITNGAGATCATCAYRDGIGGLGSSPVDAIGIGTQTAAIDPASSEDSTILFNNCQNETVAWTAGLINQTGESYSINNVAMIGINGTATFGPSNQCADTYEEAGAFDNSTSSAMFARNTYNSVTLGPADSLIINWNFQFNDS